ncbi:MAG TPA: hypothetical protein VHV75_12925 [Solirubrobacteraceae bacterium]|jgi:hypothetical protein|nr:hypothetical protein [Solirubrobacteraceae bacterium]
MNVGIGIHKLWQAKARLLLCVVLATLAAILTVYKVSPSGISSRHFEMASALTHVLVDTPTSSIIDLHESTYTLADIQDRAVVIGNILANDPVEAAIAKKAGVPDSLLRIQAPLTPKQSQPQVNSQTARHVTDVLKSNNQYRLDIEANTTIPMLDIYAQTPTAASAAALANAAVYELKIYLAQMAATEHIPVRSQIHLDQIGRATGLVINPGVDWQVALLAFLLTFAAALAATTYGARVRAGWRHARLLEQRVAGSQG